MACQIGASFLNFDLVSFTGFLKIQMTQTPNMSTFSTRRYPLGSSSFLYPRYSFPSTGDDRQLAESTTACILDELTKPYPQRLELIRTRGIVLTFRDKYSAAVKGFTHALKKDACAQEGSSVTQGPLLPSQR